MSKNEYIHTSKEISEDNVVFVGKKPSYIKYMCFVKIPKSFASLLIPELVISLLLFILRKIEVFIGNNYEAPLIIGLVAYWILMCIRSWKEFVNTQQPHHYYICNFFSYIMFLIVSYICLITPNGINTIDDVKNNIFLPLFRIALVPGILDDHDLDMAELPGTLLVFYMVTLAIIFIVPLFAMLVHRHDVDYD